MKQLYDLTDGQPIPQIAVQPKLDPNGGLVENEQGLAVKKDFIDLNSAFADRVSGNIRLARSGNTVSLSFENVKFPNTQERGYYTATVKAPIPKTGYAIQYINPFGSLYGYVEVTADGSIKFTDIADKTQGRYAMITYVCE